MENRSYRLLLVEDDALIAMNEKMQLQKIGYSVDHVLTGEAAVTVALNSDSRPDLVLMDIDLGKGIDGTQAAEQILNERDMPVVFLSSHTEPEVVEKTEEITSYGYVVKNSGITVLDASIKMALRLHSAYASAEREKRNLEQVFETNPLGMMLIDQNYEVVRVNGVAEEITGKTFTADATVRCGDFLGCLNRLLHPQVCGHTAECADCSLFSHVKLTLAERTPTGVQERLFRVDRQGRGNGSSAEETRMLRYSVSPISLNGDPAAVVALEDTTEKRKADSHVRKFARLVESGNVVIATTDPQRRTTWVNQAFEDLTGYSLAELEGQNLGAVLQGSYPDQELKIRMTKAFDNAESFETEILNFRKDGAPYWLHMDVQPLFQVDGNLEGFISIQRDISAEKRYRLGLEDRDRRLWSVLEEIDTPFTVLDSVGRTVFVNDAFARDVGYSVLHIVQLTAQDIMLLIHEDDRSKIDEALRDVVSAHHGRTSYRYRVKRATGEYVWREDDVRIFYDDNGEVDQFWITRQSTAANNRFV